MSFDVRVFDVFSQVGWAIRVRGTVEDVTESASTDQALKRLRPWTRRSQDRWLRLDVADITGHWYRAPERPPALSPSGYL